ncbi:HK97 family phage prohead protease [Ancylobacter pratisalsi]|uniref:HK97 family phage prohead protease n=2 Tax=Ancylobacter pratisalsi TaxID=1745854 RepID=A0A6P1YT22_9HYPH|nr:HK97 family phage prohead protease [Ancylobacter pratisalsi]
MTQTYDYVLDTKSIGSEGEFEGHASTFGNVDQGGDVVEPGAFIESIVRSKKEGRTIPMLWQHKQDEPIGIWTDIAEDAKGLYVRGQLILDGDPVAQRAYGKLKAKALGGMSIGYRIPPGGIIEDDKRPGVSRLKTIDLREISLVTMPMNIQARITSVKAEVAEAIERLKAGDRLSEREWERLLKAEPFGLSNSQAERAVRINLKRGQGDPDGTATNGADFLRALLTGG